MAIGPRLDLRQSQSLVMTPQLRQAIQLLQFNNLEAAAFVEQELERNPLLERDETPELPDTSRPAPDQAVLVGPPGTGPADSATAAASGELPAPDSAPLEIDDSNSYDPGGAGDGVRTGSGGNTAFDDDERGLDDLANAGPTLREHLGEQMRLTFHDAADRLIGAYLIALLEPSGRLSASPQALADAMGADITRVEAVRARMMRLDPTGMFATSLAECLAVQLAEKNRLDPAMQGLLDNLELLARHDHKRLMQICEVDAADLTDMIAEIRALDPKPGATWDATPPAPVVPDIIMRRANDGGWLLELNPETMPRVLVNQSFTARIMANATKDDRAFIADKLQTASWLVKSLQQRAQTILKVASEIVRRQDGFFRLGVAHLRPLILRDIAEATELHESTISRVTSSKYIATPRGTYELKYFFTTAIGATGGGESHSAESIRFRIKAMIDAESASDILSDDAIVAALRSEGVDIARRTVAKYREALRIPSSVQRKREKAVPA